MFTVVPRLAPSCLFTFVFRSIDFLTIHNLVPIKVPLKQSHSQEEEFNDFLLGKLLVSVPGISFWLFLSRLYGLITLQLILSVLSTAISNFFQLENKS